MGLLLALETATEAGGVALAELAGASDPVLLGEAEIDAGQRHASTLLLALDRVLADASRKLEEVELIALSIGPGSFTGLRIGLASALGLCFGTARRIVPVPTLAALSLAAAPAAYVAPMLDARRGQVYGGLYAPGAQRLRDDVVLPPRAFLAGLPADAKVTLLGPGAERYRALITAELGERATLLRGPHAAGSAARVALLGSRLARDGQALPPDRVEPCYLRPPALGQS